MAVTSRPTRSSFTAFSFPEEAEAGGQVTGSAEVLEEEDEVDSPGGAVDSRETSHERPQRRAFGRNTDRNALKKALKERGCEKWKTCIEIYIEEC